MKPKTKIQKEVAKLSATLPKLTPAQTEWAYKNGVEHIAYRTKNGYITCPDCGHEWHSDDCTLSDTLFGCRCPICGAELKVEETRKRTYKRIAYIGYLTTCRGYQVYRVAMAKFESRKGEPCRFYLLEVMQQWIAPNGTSTVVALRRGMGFMYYDLWVWDSSLEVRSNSDTYDYVSAQALMYPRCKVLPQAIRNGFDGKFYGINPIRLIAVLLSNPMAETMMKAGDVEVMKYFLSNSSTCDICWNSYKIAKRHGYTLDNISMWCDYIRMLNDLGEDIRNPKNICPQDLKDAHDVMTRRINAKRAKESAERARRYEIERREREQQRLLKEEEDKEKFIALKSKFFGLVITDNELTIKVLESVDEYYEEGKKQNICVFGAGYYRKENTLILSARIGGEIIETVEVDLRTLKVVQCHGKYNKDTEYHDRIINLVNSNAKLIRKRMTA